MKATLSQRSADGTAATDDVVILIDVDNTLLDNDRVIADLHEHLDADFGAESARHYWTIFESLRDELGYADYLGALQRYRNEIEPGGASAYRLLSMSRFLIDYPFADRLYPRALETLAHLRRFGPVVVLSDGDVVFQPLKVLRSGIWNAVGGEVLIYLHKEKMLDAVQSRYPAHRYVMIDDKERILAAMKDVLEKRLVTVFPRQGHYAHDPENRGRYPPADCTIERIGDLIDLDVRALLGAPLQDKPS
ncbi:MAG: HAD family hydrolase [Caldimonas sp.]